MRSLPNFLDSRTDKTLPIAALCTSHLAPRTSHLAPLAILFIALTTARAEAQQLELIASSLDAPAAAINWPGNPDLFVIAQRGAKKVTLHVQGPLGWLQRAEPLVDLSSEAAFPGGDSCIDLYGLTGVAFHPEFNSDRTKRFVYIRVNIEDPNSTGTITEIREYPIAPGNLTVGLQTRLLYSQVDQSSAHVVGQIVFERASSPSTSSLNLLAGIGDGTSAFSGVASPGNCGVAIDAQNLNGLNGRIVAFDVNQSNPNPVTLAYGLRNPWGLASDAGDSNGNGLGDIWIGDTGEATTGNVYSVPNAALLPNFGWPCVEWSDTSGHPGYFAVPGACSQETQCAGSTTILAPAFVAQKADFGLAPTSNDRDALIGGFVYRGSALPTMKDRYLFGSFGVAPSGPLMPKLLSVDALSPAATPVGHLGSVVGGPGGISSVPPQLNLIGISEGTFGEPILMFTDCTLDTGRIYRVIP